MAKSYHQYCPVARALDLVGERWSLLIVRELLENGALRYSDLHADLDGCGTNILAARLKQLEQGGVIHRKRLQPPASATVYELTEFGEGLRPVMHQLAHWGARVMGPPKPGELEPGWLAGALRIAFPPTTTESRIEFRVGDECASLVHGGVEEGPLAEPDAVVKGDAGSFYGLVVNRDLEAVEITGSEQAVRDILATLPPGPVAASAVA